MTYVSTCLADGAVSLWKFGEGSNASAAVDEAGNSNGSYSNLSGVTVGQTGITGGGGATAVLLIAANHGVMDSADVVANRTTDVLTYEIWVKRNSSSSGGGLISSGGSRGFLVMGASGSIIAIKSQVSAIVTSTSNVANDGAWHHVAWTKNGATNKLYIDGVDVTGSVTNATLGQSNGYGFGFDKGGSFTVSNYDGYLAMGAIYPTALSAATVLAHYNLGASAGSAPANTVAPAVTGTTAVGSVLTTTNGTWTDNGSPTFTYQWQRDVAGNLSFSNITSATSSTYTLVDADDGNKIRCRVTDTDANGATTASSNAVGLITEPVPVNTVAPAISGTKTVGQTLTSTTGTWTHQGGSVATYAYQWQRDAQGNGVYSNIPLATASTRVLTDADDGSNMKCVVTATNSGGAGSPATSSAYGLIAEPVPTNSVAPTVSGTTTVGSVLTAAAGTWTHMAGLGSSSYAYQWTRDGSNIAAATSITYTSQSADIGHAVGVTVTATNTGGDGTPTASSNTITVTAASTASFVGGGSIIALFDALEW